MCLVSLKFLMLHGGMPALPVALPLWIAAPVADTAPWQWRETLSVEGVRPGKPCAEEPQPLQAALA